MGEPSDQAGGSAPPPRGGGSQDGRNLVDIGKDKAPAAKPAGQQQPTGDSGFGSTIPTKDEAEKGGKGSDKISGFGADALGKPPEHLSMARNLALQHQIESASGSGTNFAKDIELRIGDKTTFGTLTMDRNRRPLLITPEGRFRVTDGGTGDPSRLFLERVRGQNAGGEPIQVASWRQRDPMTGERQRSVQRVRDGGPGTDGTNRPDRIEGFRPTPALPGQLPHLGRAELVLACREHPEALRHLGQNRLEHGIVQLTPAGKERAAGGLDLNNMNFRKQLSEQIASWQSGRFEGLSRDQVRTVKDLLTQMGPEKVQAFLEGKGAQRLDTGSPQLKELAQIAREIGGNAMPESMPALGGKLIATQLLDFLDRSQTNAERVPGPAEMRQATGELVRLINEFNTQQSVETGRAPLGMRDIVSNRMDAGADGAQAGQQAAIRQGESKDFVVRLPGDQTAIRAALDQIQSRNLSQAEIVGRTDGPTIKDGIRTESVQTIPLDAGGNPSDKIVLSQGEEVERLGDNLLAPGRQQMPLPEDGDGRAQIKAREDERIKREKEEQERLQKEREAEQREELAAMLAAKQKREQIEKDKKEAQKEKQKKDPEKRQKYMVRDGDTLEKIAVKMLRSKLLAGLIYEINKDIIPIQNIDGCDVPEVVPKLIIFLPTQTDIKNYRMRMLGPGLNTGRTGPTDSQKLSPDEELKARFGTGWDGGTTTDLGEDDSEFLTGESLEDMEASAMAAFKNRRTNIEKVLGPFDKDKEAAAELKYTVRLGDSLKAIAVKHHALQDVSLWRLLAEVNGLSSATDDKGVPVCDLKRGMSLVIPTREQIDVFRRGGQSGPSPAVTRDTVVSSVHDATTLRVCPDCQKAVTMSNGKCALCGHVFEPTPPALSADEVQELTSEVLKSIGFDTGTVRSGPRAAPVSTGGGDTVFFADFDSRPGSAAASEAAAPTGPVDSGPVDVQVLTDDARLVRAGNRASFSHGYRCRLELFDGTTWITLVAYEIYEDVSLRHEHRADGTSKTVRVDLPPGAAVELAENDLTAGWRTYVARAKSWLP